MKFRIYISLFIIYLYCFSYTLFINGAVESITMWSIGDKEIVLIGDNHETNMDSVEKCKNNRDLLKKYIKRISTDRQKTDVLLESNASFAPYHKEIHEECRDTLNSIINWALHDLHNTYGNVTFNHSDHRGLYSRALIIFCYLLYHNPSFIEKLIYNYVSKELSQTNISPQDFDKYITNNLANIDTLHLDILLSRYYGFWERYFNPHVTASIIIADLKNNEDYKHLGTYFQGSAFDILEESKAAAKRFSQFITKYPNLDLKPINRLYEPIYKETINDLSEFFTLTMFLSNNTYPAPPITTTLKTPYLTFLLDHAKRKKSFNALTDLFFKKFEKGLMVIPADTGFIEDLLKSMQTNDRVILYIGNAHAIIINFFIAYVFKNKAHLKIAVGNIPPIDTTHPVNPNDWYSLLMNFIYKNPPQPLSDATLTDALSLLE